MTLGYKITRKKRHITAEELFTMADRLDAKWYELKKGELVLHEPAGCEHGGVAIELLVRLHAHVNQHRLGRILSVESGFTIERNPDTVLAPDIAFIQRDRIPYKGLPIAYFEGAPDLAVEVMSPGDRFNAVSRKIDLYLSAGTRLVWTIRPRDQSAWVRRSDGTELQLSAIDSLDGEDVIPGFQCRLSSLFTG